MNARNKLNMAYVNGSLVLGGLLGLAFHSWLIFGAAVVALVALNLAAGGIRLEKVSRLLTGRGQESAKR